MISADDFDTIYEGFCYYRDHLSGNIYNFTYRDRNTKKLHIFSVTFDKSNFLHLCGVAYTRSANQFYKALGSRKIAFKDVTYKKDGTSELKLRVLPNLHMIFKKGVRVADSGKYYHLEFDKALRTGRNICALTCVSTKKGDKFVPQSLLDLQVNHTKSKSKSLNHSHAVERLTVMNIHTRTETVIFENN